MRNVTSLLPLTIMLGSPLLTHCGSEPLTERAGVPSEGVPIEPIEQSEDSLTQLGVERIIPVRFIVTGTCPDLFTPNQASFSRAVREANHMWLAAGVQFSLARFDTYQLSNIFKNMTNDMRTWSQIWQELSPIDPGIITDSLFPPAESNSAENWTHLVSAKLSKAQLRVWVACNDDSVGGGHSAFPWDQNGPPSEPDNSQYIHLRAREIADYPSTGTGQWLTTFSHEVGHYFGLTHNWEINGDPVHGNDNFFYDMYYAIEPNNSIRTFTSAADLAAYDPAGTKRKLKHGGADGTTPLPSGKCQMSNGSNGDITCNWSGQMVSTSTHGALLYPIGMGHPGQAFGNNIMSYLQGSSASGAWNQLQGLGGTQIARVKEVLRSSQGKRNLLGRGEINLSANRTAFSRRLDFDGDGKRDLAFWRWSSKSCHVQRSIDGGVVTIPIPQADMDQGDIPVPGDFDGDNKTDCAIFRRGATPNTAVWYWTRSSAGNAVTSVGFGTAGDIPIPDTKLPAPAGYGRFAIFRPSSGQYFWLTGPGTHRTVNFGQAGDEIALADYDGDGLTDLANWTPSGAQSTFYISRSSQDFASWTGWTFGTSTDIPIGPVRRDNNSYLEYAVWRPSTGQWFYLMNPSQPTGGSYTSEQWGQSSDIPLGGYDWDQDGISDAIVYRPKRGQGGGERVFYVLKSGGGSFGTPAIGDIADLPFISEDRDGDGKPEFWLFRPDTSQYFIDWSSSGYSTFGQFGFGAFIDVPF